MSLVWSTTLKAVMTNCDDSKWVNDYEL